MTLWPVVANVTHYVGKRLAKRYCYGYTRGTGTMSVLTINMIDNDDRYGDDRLATPVECQIPRCAGRELSINT